MVIGRPLNPPFFFDAFQKTSMQNRHQNHMQYATYLPRRENTPTPLEVLMLYFRKGCALAQLACVYTLIPCAPQIAYTHAGTRVGLARQITQAYTNAQIIHVHTLCIRLRISHLYSEYLGKRKRSIVLHACLLLFDPVRGV